MMQIETRAIADLKPDPGNYNRHGPYQIGLLRESLRIHGQQSAVVIRSDGTIIARHGVVEAARAEGWTEIACHTYDGPNPRAYMVADNRTAQLAEPDLAALIETLKAEDHLGQLLATGYDDAALCALIAEVNATKPHGDDFNVEEAMADPAAAGIVANVKPGEIWRLGRHRVMCGDSTKAEDVAALMGGAKAALCLTDPPYGVGWAYESVDDTPEALDALIAGFLPLAREVAPVVLVTSGNMHQKRYPAPDWTLCWFVPAGTGRGPWGFICWQPILAYGKDPYLAKGKGSYPDGFELTEGKPDVDHPCPKPLGVWQHIMERGSVKAGDTVYDPFLGSGTTLIAAERLGRVAYGMEIEPRYCDVVLARWEAETGEQAVRVADGH